MADGKTTWRELVEQHWGKFDVSDEHYDALWEKIVRAYEAEQLDVEPLRVWTTERVVLMIAGAIFFVAFIAGLVWMAVVATGGT